MFEVPCIKVVLSECIRTTHTWSAALRYVHSHEASSTVVLKLFYASDNFRTNMDLRLWFSVHHWK